MPGRESLRQQRYYAHQRNAFWPILCQLLNCRSDNYEQRVAMTVQHDIAIWDVLKSCFRDSSLDSDIDNTTLVANNFSRFFRQHSQVKSVFFNGAKAESVYRRHVLPELDDQSSNLGLHRLPSTSPAHAAMSIDDKLAAWRAVTDALECSDNKD